MAMRMPALGFSLFELLMTMALAAIVFGLGVPSFAELLADNRLRVEADALFHAVHRARKESVVRRRPITICASLDGNTCSGSFDWTDGWITFVNKGLRDPLRRDPDEELISRHQVGATSRVTANRRGFTFRSTELRATNGTLVICDQNGRSANRAIVISYTGRPRVTRVNRRGQPYDCAD